MTSWFPISPFLQYILNNKYVSLILSAYYKSKGGQEGTARKRLLYPMVPFNLWSWTSFWISLSVSVLAYPVETMKGPNEVRIQETSIPWKIIWCSTNTVRNYPGKIWGHVWCQCPWPESSWLWWPFTISINPCITETSVPVGSSNNVPCHGHIHALLLFIKLAQVCVWSYVFILLSAKSTYSWETTGDLFLNTSTDVLVIYFWIQIQVELKGLERHWFTKWCQTTFLLKKKKKNATGYGGRRSQSLCIPLQQRRF